VVKLLLIPGGIKRHSSRLETSMNRWPIRSIQQLPTSMRSCFSVTLSRSLSSSLDMHPLDQV